MALRAKSSRGYRWHPMMIRWALHLRMLSPAAYHATRTAGFVHMPSERTLQDYVHFHQAEPGFSKAVNDQLVKESRVNSVSVAERQIALLFDEMKVREDLIYDKNSGHVVRMVDLGDVNNKLLQYKNACRKGSEKHVAIATHIFVIMVRGLLTSLRFPYAHFSTTGITSSYLNTIIWEAVRHVESTGLHVLALTCDGASSNRRFFRNYWNTCSDDLPLYRVPNKYADKSRFIYFICDVPHLVKTTRNCLSHSFPGSMRRSMKVSNIVKNIYIRQSLLQLNGYYVTWCHIKELYKRDQETCQRGGLSLIPKLKLEHVQLTSFSRMRVDLAAQVGRHIVYCLPFTLLH